MQPFEVLTAVPVVKRYVEITQGLGLLVRGADSLPFFQEWVDTLTPAGVSISFTWNCIEGQFPEWRPDVPVGVVRDDATGSLRVFGTDEDAVRRAFVDNVRQMAPGWIEKITARFAGESR